MNLNAGQTAALKAVRDLGTRHPGGGEVLVISGAAGTGKSTTLGCLTEDLGSGLLVLTPTGKAAVRARELGCQARTIHSWMYAHKEDPETGEVKFTLKDFSEVQLPTCGFVVVDEASMLGFEAFRDLYSYCRAIGLNLVLVGDGHQLPPVDSDPQRQGFSVFAPGFPARYKIELTEIHRQALDNPLIRISKAVREAQWVDEVLAELDTLSWAQGVREAQQLFETGDGVAICHRNTTRHQLNFEIRANLGYPRKALVADEPLLVTTNNYLLDLYNGETLSYRDGEVLTETQVVATDRRKGSSIFTDLLGFKAPDGRLAVVSDREVFGDLVNVSPYFVRRAAEWWIYQRHRGEPRDRRPSYLHTNLGYALTCHKAQGSEWPEVLVCLEDSLKLNTTDGRAWIYTALTRAKSRARIFYAAAEGER